MIACREIMLQTPFVPFTTLGNQEPNQRRSQQAPSVRSAFRDAGRTGRDLPKQPVVFHGASVRNAGGEIDVLFVAAAAAIAEGQPPQSWDVDWVPSNVLQGPNEIASGGVESIDATVAEVADQKVVPEWPKARRRQRQAPRGVQCAPGNEPPDQAAIQIEYIHKTMA